MEERDLGLPMKVAEGASGDQLLYSRELLLMIARFSN